MQICNSMYVYNWWCLDYRTEYPILSRNMSLHINISNLQPPTGGRQMSTQQKTTVAKRRGLTQDDAGKREVASLVTIWRYFEREDCWGRSSHLFAFAFWLSYALTKETLFRQPKSFLASAWVGVTRRYLEHFSFELQAPRSRPSFDWHYNAPYSHTNLQRYWRRGAWRWRGCRMPWRNATRDCRILESMKYVYFFRLTQHP